MIFARFSALRVSLTLIAVTYALVAPLAFAQPPKGVQTGATVEGVTEYQLANGLKVLLFPDQAQSNVIVNVIYLVGSRHEGSGETGMAHLLEHMLFKQTKIHKDIFKELKDRGALYNGTTHFDRTNYYEAFPPTDDNLRWALGLEADRMVNSLILKSDLDSEMTVVRNELERGENDPDSVLLSRVLHTAYLWHGYGRMPIGARSDIENVPIERLQAFYRKYYQPDNAILVVSGRFAPEKVLPWIVETFGRIPRPERKLYPTYTVEPTQDGERLVTLQRTGDTPTVLVAYHLPAAPHPDFAALEVLGMVLGDDPSGRLYKALVDGGKAASAGGGASRLREPSVATFSASLQKGQSLEEARGILLTTLDNVAQQPPTAEEVERAKTRILKSLELQIADGQDLAMGLTEWVAIGDWRLLFLHRDRVQAVTVADVERVARQYLKPSNRTVGLFVPTEQPDRAEIPPVLNLAAMLNEYKGQTGVSAGEVFDPSYANIEKRIQRSQLPGGLKLVMLPKKTRAGLVLVSVRLFHGDAQNLVGKQAVADLTGAMLGRGTKAKSRQQIQDELDRLKTSGGAGGDTEYSVGALQTTRENLPAALGLVAELLREPSFPESEFAVVRSEKIADTEQTRSEPQTIAMTEILRHLGPEQVGAPRYIPTPDETIADLTKVSLAQAREFYQGFYGASHGVLGIIGDFDPGEVEKLARELFDNWNTPAHTEPILREAVNVEPVDRWFETADKANAFFVAGLSLDMNEDHPDYAALTLVNHLMGSGLQSRLAKRIRRQEGLSYSVGSALTVPLRQKRAQWVATAITAPENILKVQDAFRDELKKAFEQGFSGEEVEQGKKSYLQEQEVGRSMDQLVLTRMMQLARWDQTFARDQRKEQAIAALTADQVNAAFRRYLRPDRLSYVKAGDFKRAGIKY